MGRARWSDNFDQNRDRYVSELMEYLRFASVSAQPEHQADCEQCAEWLSEHLGRIGFETRILKTSGKPVVYAERAGEPGAPVVLYYGHYDVQPVDPLHEWDSPPFEPELRGGRIFARGAQDNKGQTMFVLKALESLLECGRLRPTMKLLIEGEEETGSAGLQGRLEEWAELLKSDVLMVCDTGCVDLKTPTVILGLRGMVHLTVKLGGITRDLHSGQHGGIAKNPALELARLLSTLHDESGRIAVAGYYDNVIEVSAADRKLLEELPFDEAEYELRSGVPPLGGERGLSPQERSGFRPTVEVNGLVSGYGGAGTKTIIPREALAKLTSRLVGGQDPERCLSLLKAHLTERAPEGLRLEFPEGGIGGPALLVSSQLPLLQRVRSVLSETAGGAPLFDWEGGSIPVIAGLAQASGAEPVLVGFGLDEDNIHAPNESFSLEQFKQGYLYAAGFLEALGSD